MHALGRFLVAIGKATASFGTVMMIVMLTTVVASVVLRDVFDVAYAWLLDVSQWGMIWTVYIAAVQLGLRNDHISMDALYIRFPWAIRRWINIVMGLAAFGVSVYVAYLGFGSAADAAKYGQMSNSGLIPAWLGYAVIPLAFALLALTHAHYLLFVARDEKASFPSHDPEEVGAP